MIPVKSHYTVHILMLMFTWVLSSSVYVPPLSGPMEVARAYQDATGPVLKQTLQDAVADGQYTDAAKATYKSVIQGAQVQHTTAMNNNSNKSSQHVTPICVVSAIHLQG